MYLFKTDLCNTWNCVSSFQRTSNEHIHNITFHNTIQPTPLQPDVFKDICECRNDHRIMYYYYLATTTAQLCSTVSIQSYLYSALNGCLRFFFVSMLSLSDIFHFASHLISILSNKNLHTRKQKDELIKTTFIFTSSRNWPNWSHT